MRVISWERERQMDRIKKILAPTDLSEFSGAGVGYALDLARALGAEVTAYHVVSHEELAQLEGELEPVKVADAALWQANRLLKSYQLALARFLNRHFSDLIPWVRIREKVELGVPDKNIVEWARREGSDLIVISIRAGERSSPAPLRGLAEEIVRQAPCPVLSVQSGAIVRASRKAAAVA